MLSVKIVSPEEMIAARWRLLEELRVALLPPSPHNTKLYNALSSVLRLANETPVKKLPSRVKEN